MKNNNYLEYVMSGPSHTRITFKEGQEEPELKKWMLETFTKMNTLTEHKFSLLYNAWTESVFGSKFAHYKPALNAIYADSGGLQIVTQGLTVTDKIKTDVFKNQSDWSDCAMCFDEIPLSFEGEKSSRLDLSNRWFDASKFELCASTTGKNIDEQIKCFLDEKSKAKPIIIIQGNCYDTYMKWTELVMANIAPERRKYIGGVAMGAAALGHGLLEDIRRSYFFTQLPIEVEQKHIHFLAVGSLKRLLPPLVFAQTGVYSDTRISYDSTSHSSGVNYGRVYDKNSWLDFPRTFDKVIYGRIFDQIKDMFPVNFTVEEYFKVMNTPSLKCLEEFGNRTSHIQSFAGTAMISIFNFMTEVDRIVDSKKMILERATEEGMGNVISSLYGIKTKSDFDMWEKEIAAHVKSHPVLSEKKEASNLNDFFS